MSPHAFRATGLLACAALLSVSPCRAQESPPTAAEALDLDPAEIERLRAEAEAEVAAPAISGDQDPRGLLRAQAAASAEDGDDLLYDQLLDAFGAVANRLNAFNPRITVFGDVLARLSAGSHELVHEEDGEEVNFDDRIALREVELDFRADIDPYAKGVLILAAHEEAPGEIHFEIEEGYLTLETLPWGLRAQVGRFRMPFGQMNRLHTHDLPQSTRPYALDDIFGHEGFVETGALVSWLAPYVPLELTAGILNGENEAVFAGSASDDPAWFGRVQSFTQLTDTLFVTAGNSLVYGFQDAPAADEEGPPSREALVYGADLMVKWQPSQFTSVVFQAELYQLWKDAGPGEYEYARGAFAFLQVQPLQRWFFGVRYDYSDYMEGQEDTEQWAVGGYVSYYTTEFLRFRLGYEHRERHSTGGGEPDLDTVYFQLTFVFGSHPVEPFWFNR